MVGWLVFGVKANCSLAGPAPVGGVLSVGVFLRDPSPNFGENDWNLRTARSTSATEEWTWHFPSTSFWAQPFVGPTTDSSTSMRYPGFEPGTFGSATGFPDHFTVRIRIIVLISGASSTRHKISSSLLGVCAVPGCPASCCFCGMFHICRGYDASSHIIDNFLTAISLFFFLNHKFIKNNPYARKFLYVVKLHKFDLHTKINYGFFHAIFIWMIWKFQQIIIYCFLKTTQVVTK